MKNDTKARKVLLYTGAGAAALAGICAYMIAPGRRDREQRAPFMGRNYAHRGLHRIDKSVPENSIPAFEAAAGGVATAAAYTAMAIFTLWLWSLGRR